MHPLKIIAPVFLFAIITLQSCSNNKKKTVYAPVAPAVPLSTEWSVNGITYKGTKITYNDTTSPLGSLSSMDSAGNFISVIIFSHPKASGTYAVSMAATPVNCFIQVGVFKGTALTMYKSTSKAGDSVKLAISPETLTATFNNITVAKGADTTTVSGTIIR
jgi:hypothetical protein